MILARFLPIILSSWLLGAHYLRADNLPLFAACLLAPSLLLYKRRWVIYAISGLLILGALIWIQTAVTFVQIRQAFGMPYGRMILILGAVAAFTLLSGIVFTGKRIKNVYSGSVETAWASTAAFFLTGILLAIAHIKVSIPILLLERFIPGGGWFEIFVLSIYAAWITEKMLDRSVSSKWRRRIWLLFSIVFFAQLLLGLSGFEKFLMTGSLHLPVPAVIVAGPIFRWKLSIMMFLFLGSVLVVGPAWCSHLCYIGAWDDIASRGKKKPKVMPGWAKYGRLITLVLVVLAAMILDLSGLPTIVATSLGLAFGIIGVAVMILWSRKAGAMTHCIAYCPIGLLATGAGKISPFRLRINSSCTDCGICRLSCRYDALNMPNIKDRKPGINCTLCGDCIGSCDDRAIEYRFPGLKAQAARTLFIVLAVSLHTVFLGLGRL